MSAKERKDFELEKKAYKTITGCLPNDVMFCFKNQETTFDLWDMLAQVFGAKEEDIKEGPNNGISEKVLTKENELQALKSQILTMEIEYEAMRLKIVGLVKRISEFEDQQTGMTKLMVDHDLALKTLQDLREQISNVSQPLEPPITRTQKISMEKSSEPLLRMVLGKKISQFTSYSLQKNKKYSEKSKSTRTSAHQKVDCCDDSVNFKGFKSSVFRFQKQTKALNSTQPESRQRKSYSREKMFALAPPRSHHMV